mgnify:CR=1 FL=1
MQSSHPSLLLDRRREPRLHGSREAFIRAWDAPVGDREDAVVEDVSESGLRLRSFASLHPGDSVRLEVPGGRDALRARVAWIHPGGLMGRPRMHVIDEVWMVGCVVQGASRAELRRLRKSIDGPGPGIRPSLTAALRMAGIAGILGLLAYGFVVLARSLGGSFVP